MVTKKDGSSTNVVLEAARCAKSTVLYKDPEDPGCQEMESLVKQDRNVESYEGWKCTTGTCEGEKCNTIEADYKMATEEPETVDGEEPMDGKDCRTEMCSAGQTAQGTLFVVTVMAVFYGMM